MSLKPHPIDPVPEETARVVRAAYPKGNIYVQLRDEFGTIYEDEHFQDLYPRRGQPAEAPWRLALVSVMQFREGLSDRQAADAVRGRLDWKYLLGLALDDPGFDASVLVEFRHRLLTSKEETLLFDLFLTKLREHGYLKTRGRQRTDSTHVLAKVRSLNRVERVGETFRAALNSLAVVAPEWLQEQWQEGWIERYEHRVEDYRLPDGKQAREAYALIVGNDGTTLLSAVYAETAPSWIREIPAVQTLRHVWVQHFYWDEADLRWRDLDNAPPAGAVINSPYDPQALYAQKRETSWIGYKVHVTETCDENAPHLITHSETTPAPQADDDVIPHIHHALASHEVLPQQHLVDTGYVDAQELVRSRQQYGVDLFGPSREDYHWQARTASGFEASHFAVDWQKECATCPAGKLSSSWSPVQDRRGNPVIPHQVCHAGLSSLSCPSALHAHAINISSSSSYDPSPTGVASLTSGTPTASHTGVQNGLQQTCWHRRDAFTRHSRLWVATSTLPRSSQSPSPTRFYCRRTQSLSNACLAHGTATREDTASNVRASCQERSLNGWDF